MAASEPYGEAMNLSMRTTRLDDVSDDRLETVEA